MARRPRRATSVPVVVSGVVTREALPLPWVHYPSHYGTLVGFSVAPDVVPSLCSCVRTVLENMARGAVHSRDRRRVVRQMIPDALADSLPASPEDWASAVAYAERACHRCNMASPSVRWCHEMYGGRFLQYFGWYVQQARVRLGVNVWFDNGETDLLDVMPPAVRGMRAQANADGERHMREHAALYAKTQKPRRPEIGPDTVQYWSNVLPEEATALIAARRAAAKSERMLTRFIENQVRAEFGFRAVGEAWVSESLLAKIGGTDRTHR